MLANALKVFFSALSLNDDLSDGLHPSYIAREATTADLEPILELLFKIFAEPVFNDSAQGFDLLARMQKRYAEDPGKHEREFWGADKNKRYALVLHDRQTGELVGTAWLIADLDCDSSECAGEINKIYLLPECRGKGLGYWLMRKLISKARQLGFLKISLITAREKVRALSLYTRLGFVPAKQGRYIDCPHTIAMVYNMPICRHGESCELPEE